MTWMRLYLCNRLQNLYSLLDSILLLNLQYSYLLIFSGWLEPWILIFDHVSTSLPCSYMWLHTSKHDFMHAKNITNLSVVKLSTTGVRMWGLASWLHCLHMFIVATYNIARQLTTTYIRQLWIIKVYQWENEHKIRNQGLQINMMKPWNVHMNFISI